jgi:hypothetical protein
MFSPEWYDAIHTALKTATELDIDVGLFNCPGWSQSGGPWIKPEQSMRYLASSETRVKGPAKIEQQLLQPTEHFQDVRVLAVPVAKDYMDNLLKEESAKPTYSNNVTKDAAQIRLPAGESSIEVRLPEEKIARSLVIYPAGMCRADVELQVKEGEVYRTVRQFVADRTNSSLRVGFDPYAPVAVSFPEVQAREYRIVFQGARAGSAIRSIVLSSTPAVERYAEKSLAKMNQTYRFGWHDYLWNVQPELHGITVPASQQVLDLSQYMNSNGVLVWDVPEGDWLILRTGMAPTGVANIPPSPAGEGLEVDKMSRKHVAMHFDAFIGDIMKRVPAEDRKSLKMVVQDSYETGSQNFTDGMIDEFKERYGYDPVPFLPVYFGHVIGSPDMSDRFLWDMRRMVADKIAYDYVGGMREISHQNGLVTWLENYGHWGFPGEFLQYGGQSDEIGGEFWNGGNDIGDAECRLASSCAHIYGKQRVYAESFTSSGFVYGRHPSQLKAMGDWAFTLGINNTVFHVSILQSYEDRYPGTDAWFGTEFNRHNTWFSQADVYLQYIKRCNYMLQQGLNVADVAYFIGEDTPKIDGIRNPELPKGYSFDYINAEVIIRDMSVKDGKLVLPHGTSYRVLVLPPLETMTPELLQKLEQLAAAGGVILGPPPSRSPSMKNYPQADEQIKALAKKMWGDTPVKKREYGKGLILSDMSMEEVFALLHVTPDFLTADNDPVLYNHRTVDGTEIYFVSNQSDRPVTIKPQFRVMGLLPELWDAVTGEILLLPAFEQKDETAVVPLKLEAYGSAFVVFRKKGSPAASDIAANYPEPTVKIPVNSAWKVRFESDAVKRGPSETVTFAELKDWTQSEDERIRYYSGTAVYTTQFTVEDNVRGKKWYLDLGKVSVMAKVKINGAYAGGVWTAPYRVNVTKYLKQGENTLEIEVVNTWVNRIIGDLNLPDEQRKVRPNYNSWKADSPLQSSGLTGPVEIIAVEK